MQPMAVVYWMICYGCLTQSLVIDSGMIKLQQLERRAAAKGAQVSD